MFDWSRIFPPKQNNYEGSKIAFCFLILIGLKDIFRSSVHYFAPDGGAGIIAGIPLESYSEGAVMTIINSFGVYGAHQLIFTIILWGVLIRYRAWIPLIYLLIVITEVLGFILFLFKPLPVTPPGQIGVYILLPLTAILFLLSLKKS